MTSRWGPEYRSVVPIFAVLEKEPLVEGRERAAKQEESSNRRGIAARRGPVCVVSPKALPRMRKRRIVRAMGLSFQLVRAGFTAQSTPRSPEKRFKESCAVRLDSRTVIRNANLPQQLAIRIICI